MRICILLLTTFIASPALAQASKPAVTLNAAEEPEAKAWTQPASFAFTSRAKAQDFWALDAALKVEFQPAESSSTTMFIRGTVNRSTQEDKEAANYSGKVGVSFDFNTAQLDANSTRPAVDAFYFYGDAALGLNHKTIFKDPKAECATPPLPAVCGRQAETSLRGTFSLQPFHSAMETTFYQKPSTGELDGPAVTHLIVPIFTLFQDSIVDAKVNASGIKPRGGVTGGKAEIKAAFSLRFTDYRLIFSGTLQHVQAFHRAERRREGFQRSSTLYTLAADYELGPRSFSGGDGLIPAFGVSYAKGDDPLAAKQDLDTVVVAVKLTYKGGK